MKTINLEGQEYMLIAELQFNGTEYLHLAKTDNPKEFCIRKINVIDGKRMIVGLDGKEEFDMALLAFRDKHIKDLEN